jgi:hypothetical protein
MKTAGRLLIALIVIGSIVSLTRLFSASGPVGSENLIGQPVRPFAAPLAGSGIGADSNIFTKAEAKNNGSTAACDVQIPGSFNSCEELKGTAIITFWHAGKANCERQVDEVEKLVAEDPKIKAVAVAFENSLNDASDAASSHDWRHVKVAVDRDGAVSSIYDVTGCPSTFFVRNGVIRAVRLGLLDRAELKREIAQVTNG